MDKMNNFYAYLNGFEFLFYSLIMCTILFNIISVNETMQATIHMFYLITMLLITFFVNFHAESITKENFKFSETIYNMPWYVSGKNTKYAIKFMLMRSQSPPHLTLGYVHPMGLQSFVLLLNTTYSYFTVLRSMMWNCIDFVKN